MKNRRGAALILVLVMTVMVVGSMGAVAGYSISQRRTSFVLNNAIEAGYACEATLEMVRDQVKQSTYDINGNVWLAANSSSMGKSVYSSLKLGRTTVDMVLFDEGTGAYRAEATGVIDKTRIKVTQEIKGRDAFSKYAFFIDNDNVSFGTSTVKGYVHCNKTINFYFGGARFYKEVTARLGFNFVNGASRGNTFFYGGSNSSAPLINMPSTNAIATLSNVAQGVYRVSNASADYSGFGTFNTEIKFLRDRVMITAKNPINGNILKQGTYPLPPDGLIYVSGNVTSLEGDVAGRVTVACMGQVDITNKVRYVDANGNPAYRLTNGFGTPVADTAPGIVWDEVNYKYQPNPDYAPSAPSTLGILAANDVRITNGAPYNMELHAAIFSAVGRWYCDLGLKKGNLRTLSSMVMKLGGWRYNSLGYGYAQSGVYTYDNNLLANPPPHWLKVDAPTFGPRFKG